MARTVDQTSLKGKLIVGKKDAGPSHEMKATSSMLRRLGAEEKVLKAAKSLFGKGFAAKGLGQLLKQLDLREIEIPEGYEKEG